MRRSLSVVVASGLAVLPNAAFACSVCFDARDEVRVGYLMTTGVLSLLPLALIAGTAYWLWRASSVA